MIKGVLFDKDGTLMKFSDLWILCLNKFMGDKNLDTKVQEEIRVKAGFTDSGVALENSIIASGTMAELSQICSKAMGEDVDLLTEELNDYFREFVKEHPEKVIETCDLHYLFKKLKKKGISIGVVTSDSYLPTVEALKILKVYDMVDFIAAGDMYAPKPSRESLDLFLNKIGIEDNEVIMVGDSAADMEFGKYTNSSIGVLCGTGSKSMLSKYTKHIIDSPIDILKMKEIEIIKEE